MVVSAVVCADGHDELRAQVLHRRGDRAWHDGRDAPPARRSVGDRGRAHRARAAPVRRRSVGRRGRDLGADHRPQACRRPGRDARRGPPRRGCEPEAGRQHLVATRRWTSSSNATLGRMQQPGTSCSRARTVDGSPTATAPSRDASDRLDQSPRWASTCVYLPPIHPIGRTPPQGPRTTRRRAGPTTSGSPWAIGDEPTAATPRCTRSSARVDDFARSSASPRERRHGGRARPRVPVHARPPVGARAPEWFHVRADGTSPTPRTRRSVRGHRPARLRQRRTGARLWEALPTSCGTGSRAASRVPRRQPAHQAVRVLAVADRRDARGATPASCSSPRRSPARR